MWYVVLYGIEFGHKKTVPDDEDTNAGLEMNEKHMGGVAVSIPMQLCVN